MTTDKTTWRRLLRTAVWAVGLGLLARVLWASREGAREVLSHRPDGRYLALAFVLCLFALASTFLRWRIMVRAQGIPLRILDAVRVGFIGNAIDLVIPGQVGGDVYKASFLCQGQERKTRVIASILIDRAIGVLGLFLLAGAMGLWNWPATAPQVRPLIVVVWSALFFGVLGLGAVFSPPLLRSLERALARRERFRMIAGDLHAMSLAYRDRKGAIALGLTMSTISHTLYALSFAAISAALLPHPPSVSQHLQMVPLVLFTTIFPLPFGALGLSEQVSDELFSMIHHPSGALSMLGFRVVGLAVACVSISIYIANARGTRDPGVPPEGDAPLVPERSASHP
jgi:glycosyltransferase 2 family protein